MTSPPDEELIVFPRPNDQFLESKSGGSKFLIGHPQNSLEHDFCRALSPPQWSVSWKQICPLFCIIWRESPWPLNIVALNSILILMLLVAHVSHSLMLLVETMKAIYYRFGPMLFMLSNLSGEKLKLLFELAASLRITKGCLSLLKDILWLLARLFTKTLRT